MFVVSRRYRDLITVHLPRQTLVFISHVDGPVQAKHARGPQHGSISRPCLDHYRAPQLASEHGPSELTVDFFVTTCEESYGGHITRCFPNQIPVQQFIDKVAAVFYRVPWTQSPTLYQPVCILRVLNAQLTDGYTEQLLSTFPAAVSTSLHTLYLKGQYSQRQHINRPPFSFCGGALPHITTLDLDDTPVDLRDIAVGLPNLTSLNIASSSNILHQVIGWPSVPLLTALQHLGLETGNEDELRAIVRMTWLSSLSISNWASTSQVFIQGFSRLHTLSLSCKNIGLCDDQRINFQTGLDVVAMGSPGVRKLSLFISFGFTIPEHWNNLEDVEVNMYTAVPQLPSITRLQLVDERKYVHTDYCLDIAPMPRNLLSLEAPFDALLSATRCNSLSELIWTPAYNFPMSKHASLLVAAFKPEVWPLLNTAIIVSRRLGTYGAREKEDVYSMQLCEILATRRRCDITHVTLHEGDLSSSDVKTLSKMPLVSLTLKHINTKLTCLLNLLAMPGLKLILLDGISGLTSGQQEELHLAGEKEGVLVQV